MAIVKITLEEARYKNEQYIRRLHPTHREIFSDFVRKCESAGLPILIFSGLRSFSKQLELYNAYKTGKSKIKAAKPGRSLHEFGLAIDAYVWNNQKKYFEKNFSKYQQLSRIANSIGLRWLGSTMKNESHHFDYNNYNINDLVSLRNRNIVDESGYVDLSKINENKKKTLTKINELYSTEVGQQFSSEETEDEEIKEKNPRTKVTRVEEMQAVGIWKIIKLVADQYSLSQNINDATIAFNQGSILNFIQNVVQEPWLEFWGDTIGDQYYFNVRKQPFDYFGWTKLPTQAYIYHDNVIGDDLNWYEGPIYSWYQIIPRGSFLGEQNLIFAYVTAVFFQEYAEIWGSKPNIQVSNYINFIKNQGKATLFEKALEDLRYMVESNMYLPFTRQGTITIRGRSNIRRGYKIIYFPTNEVFYVSAVSNRYMIGENGPEYTTILKVERGMKIAYTISPENRDTKSYWNLINFEKQKPVKVKETVKIPTGGGFSIFFDNDRPYKIDLKEEFGNSKKPADIKMVKQIKQYPDLRLQLDNVNYKQIELAVEYLEGNKKAKKFRTIGYIDPDNKAGSRWLSEQRAIFFKNIIISEYLKKYNSFTKSQLEDLIDTRPDYDARKYKPIKSVDPEEGIQPNDVRDHTLKLKAHQRYASFYMDEYEEEITKEVESNEIAWGVNKPVFQFFLNRLQNGR